MILVKLGKFLFCLTYIFSVNIQELACSASYGIVTGLFLSNKNRIGVVIDRLALVLRETSRD